MSIFFGCSDFFLQVEISFDIYIYCLALSAGLFLDLDSDDDMELSPLEQLESTLNQLHLTVQFLCGNNEESPKLNGKNV